MVTGTALDVPLVATLSPSHLSITHWFFGVATVDLPLPYGLDSTALIRRRRD
jgi:hypothetical protein